MNNIVFIEEENNFNLITQKKEEPKPIPLFLHCVNKLFNCHLFGYYSIICFKLNEINS